MNSILKIKSVSISKISNATTIRCKIYLHFRHMHFGPANVFLRLCYSIQWYHWKCIKSFRLLMVSMFTFILQTINKKKHERDRAHSGTSWKEVFSSPVNEATDILRVFRFYNLFFIIYIQCLYAWHSIFMHIYYSNEIFV